MNACLFSPHLIRSLLDLDAYKINMMQAIHSFYPDVQVRYELIVRSDEDVSDLLEEVREKIAHLASLRFSDADITYLEKSSPHLKASFLQSLRYFHFQPERQVEMGIIKQEGKHQLRIAIQGAWRDTILYETLVMAIVSEVRSRRRWSQVPIELPLQVLAEKVQTLKVELKKRGIENFSLTEMGTRRRFSSQVQRDVIAYLHQEIPELLLGTSNYHFAREFNLKPIGTIAHEWFMGHQALVNVGDSQRVALEQWLRAFDGQLSIAPTDTLTIDAFIRDFNVHLAKAYDGVRHDSGCPFTWGDKMLAHYKKLGIDPKNKLFIFSDGLNFDQALSLCEYFAGRVRISFGIGTFLTNDLAGWKNDRDKAYQPLSMVIKLTECNGRPVAKVSDEPEKAMCEDPIFLANLKQRFNIEVDMDRLILELQQKKSRKRQYIAAA
ncbi:nicotinate phosphoribosyltransferase [Vibrio sp. V27_P1S3P104]|uniref:nicotinate phosphoribosyltransferase n=2 Tax=Vibrio TaxID=662 RepID=UPI001372DC9A|nr:MULTISPECIES: nicotinate phosphoribosyltransferase [unclassified Vibrio]NAW68325.1 nicotinate phosphoribosyltransferase [Vibrio sp. V28_P6S34P95]NAX03949.1 nicotinate phosphoribosyltransferase [Vibrio sp. V30_P3S12P165]NAX34747.1 nicotinate phosphoribosyltransferase [Vibrio sp. V29_P1S30P107]NAX36821.1 nicotinate phosphoribosyltransferase [Vibrio sp. V27_P1S3P104]NAX41083.1 nicotinate phosphoribosyltransferase [Vibrio sp. V26_P1S5P106]